MSVVPWISLGQKFNIVLYFYIIYPDSRQCIHEKLFQGPSHNFSTYWTCLSIYLFELTQPHTTPHIITVTCYHCNTHKTAWYNVKINHRSSFTVPMTLFSLNKLLWANFKDGCFFCTNLLKSSLWTIRKGKNFVSEILQEQKIAENFLNAHHKDKKIYINF